MVSPPITRIRDQVTSVLASRERLPFLSRLAWELTLYSRDLYPPSGSDAYQQAFSSIGLNEILHVLTDALWSEVDEPGSINGDRLLVERLNRFASAWKCETVWTSSLRAAVARFTPALTDVDSPDETAISESASDLIDSDEDIAFLAELTLLFGTSAHTLKPPPHRDASAFAKAVSCTQSLLIRIVEQVREDIQHDDDVRDDADFVSVLIDEADQGRCTGVLRFVLDRTLRAFSEVPWSR